MIEKTSYSKELEKRLQLKSNRKAFTIGTNVFFLQREGIEKALSISIF